MNIYSRKQFISLLVQLEESKTIKLQRKQYGKKKRKFYNMLSPRSFHGDIRKAILRSDMKCNFKDKKGI